MAGLQTYRRLIEAGGRQTIDVVGRTVVIRDVTGEVLIRARAQTRGAGDGEAFENVMRKFEKWFLTTDYDTIEIENPSEDDTLEVVLLLGFGDYVREVTSRSSVGKFNNQAGYFNGPTYEGQELLPSAVKVTQLCGENLQRSEINFILDRLPTGVMLNLRTEDDTFEQSGTYEKFRCNGTLTDAGGGHFTVSGYTQINPFNTLDALGPTLRVFDLESFEIIGERLQFVVKDSFDTILRWLGDFRMMRLRVGANYYSLVNNQDAFGVEGTQVGATNDTLIIFTDLDMTAMDAAGTFSLEFIGSGHPSYGGTPVLAGIPIPYRCTGELFLFIETTLLWDAAGAGDQNFNLAGIDSYYDT